MAYTFLKHREEIGKSLVDDSKLDYCKEMMDKAKSLGKELLLPVDTTIAASFPEFIDGPIRSATYPQMQFRQIWKDLILEQRQQNYTQTQ